MSDTLLLTVAVAVFSLMLIGLVLTVLEFSRGEPARQEEEGADSRTRDGDDR